MTFSQLCQDPVCTWNAAAGPWKGSRGHAHRGSEQQELGGDVGRRPTGLGRRGDVSELWTDMESDMEKDGARRGPHV